MPSPSAVFAGGLGLQFAGEGAVSNSPSPGMDAAELAALMKVRRAGLGRVTSGCSCTPSAYLYLTNHPGLFLCQLTTAPARPASGSRPAPAHGDLWSHQPQTNVSYARPKVLLVSSRMGLASSCPSCLSCRGCLLSIHPACMYHVATHVCTACGMC